MEDPEKGEGGGRRQYRFPDIICNRLLKICFFIAILDLAQSLFYFINRLISVSKDPDPYSVLALVGAAFWILMAILLIVGLWKSYYRLIIGWLCFTAVGTVLDICLFIWIISVSDYIDWSIILQYTVVYLGIVSEWIGIFIVYKYCDSLRSCLENEKTMKDIDETGPPQSQGTRTLFVEHKRRMRREAKEKEKETAREQEEN